MADTKKIQPDLSFIKGVMAAGGDTVNKCYQCATCSVVCPLSTEDRPFPRKEMLWAQWGLADKIAGDADVWLCHQCGDCSAYCPRDAKPGDVLGAIRLNAIKHYAEPKALADLLTNTAGVLGTVIAAFVVWYIVAFLWSLHTGVDFPFPKGEVNYHEYFTFIPIDIVVLPIVGLVVWASYKGVTNFWADISKGSGIVSYTGTGSTPPLGILFTKYAIPAFQEILSHKRFEECGQTAERAKGHKLLLWSFIMLFIVTTVVFILNDIIYVPFLGEEFTPMPLYNPIKIFANIAAIMLIVGAWLIIKMRKQKTAEGVLKSSEQDWILIWLIFSVGITGVAAELFRLMGIGGIAYPTYILHLATVVTLFLAVPYSKFAHLLYRTTAYVYQRYEEDMKAGKAGFGLEVPVNPVGPPPEKEEEKSEEAEEKQEEAKEEEKA
ncbi:MAG: heterodisulfide reductase [Thermodesulfatator sp.]|nr:MAG: heterodisulfide reductase [Thermodesulfatator sp.]